jgi:hypothetical protein
MPLEKLKELSRGTRMAERDFAHLTSNTIDSIVTSIGRLPQEVRKEMGALLLARLNFLQETIHSYISADARVYPGDFPYPWSEGDEILPVYCDIAIQLALQRAQDGSNDEPEVRRFGREWSQKEENRFGHSGFDKYRLYVEDIPQVHPPVSEYLKDSPFAVLFILAFKQAYYHTLRAWLIGGSDSKMGVSVRTNEGSFIFECVIKNPQVLLDDPDKTSKEAFEFEELAKHFSSIPEAPVHYSTIGPAFNVNDRCWCTTIKIGKRI